MSCFYVRVLHFVSLNTQKMTIITKHSHTTHIAPEPRPRPRPRTTFKAKDLDPKAKAMAKDLSHKAKAKD